MLGKRLHWPRDGGPYASESLPLSLHRPCRLGNKAFEAKDYDQAIAHYTEVGVVYTRPSYCNLPQAMMPSVFRCSSLQALELDPDNHIYYSNRR